MTWKEISVMDARLKFIADVLNKEDSLSALCTAYGISRPTGYKWIKRYQEEGPSGLEERSRAPHTQVQAVSTEIEKEVQAMRKKFPRYGPKKLRVELKKKDATKNWPSTSTIGEILKRKNLIVSRKQKNRAKPSGEALTEFDQVNRVWCADFKGDFKTGDGHRCFPLTVSE
ncbi:MAG: helix-turn-helix domain containing protein, partial [candidate division Zixibacteria bacterium]|nr:helix-turn-helix domain containing protein [candidate division Zixibacteria bacterium]